MKIQTSEIYVFPLDDLHCGFGIQQGNIMPSLPYIPGRVIRGGLAGWVIRNTQRISTEDKPFKNLFLSEAGETKVSFPFCTPSGNIVPPLSLFELTGGRHNPRTYLLANQEILFIEGDVSIKEKIEKKELFGPVDFLRRKLWPSDVDASFKPSRGTIDYESSSSIKPEFSMKIDLKAAHDDTKGRVKDEDGLFAIELMPSSVSERVYYYKGKLVYEQKDEFVEIFQKIESQKFDPDMINRAELDAINPKNIIFIGRRKIPAAIFIKPDKLVDTEKDAIPGEIKKVQTDKCLTITLTNNCIPPNECNLRDRGNVFCQIFKDFRFLKQRSFCKISQVHAWDIEKHKPETFATLSAGSCILAKADLSEDAMRTLWILSLFGIGAHCRDGYGRFIVNWDLHDISK